MSRPSRCKAMIGCAFLLTAHAACADQPATIEALWAMVQAQQAEIDALKRELRSSDEKLDAVSVTLAETEQAVAATGDYLEGLALPAAAPGGLGEAAAGTAGTHIGGYGELHYNNLDADDSGRDVEQIDLHRFVLYFGHQFNDRVKLVSELEVEHAFSGDTADGSNAGEVEVEQAYIEFGLRDGLAARGGLFLIPVGLLNETHEPNTFYGVERNDVENIIIPSTWWEGGASLGGRHRSGVSWDLAVHSGLEIPVSGSSAFRVRSGRQKVSEAHASDPAYSLRLRYTGVPGLELATTWQYQSDPSQMPGDGLDSGRLWEAHAVFNRGMFGLRAMYAGWNFRGDAVEAADADRQTGWYLEPSLRWRTAYGDVGVYTRYEDLDGARTQDRFSQWELGLNYWPVDQVVLKVDWRDREHDLMAERGRDFGGLDLGIGYQF